MATTTSEPPTTTPQQGESKARRRALAWTATIAGCFCFLVCATLLSHHLGASQNDPWKSSRLLNLKAKLVAEPENEAVKKEIRAIDAEFRGLYRKRLSLDRSGGWLLVLGTLALLVSARGAVAAIKVFQAPTSRRDPEAVAARVGQRARWTTAVASGVICVGLVVVAVAEKPVPLVSAKKEPAKATIQTGATLEQFKTNFPRFRGWDGSGFVADTGAPLTWNGESGEGILWRTPSLAPGHGSPIVWGNQLFLTAATAQLREVFAYDLTTGKLLWRRAIEKVPGSPAKMPELADDTGYAASTPATDGQFVYALFANGDLAALDFSGTVAWSRSFGALQNPYGHAASLAIWPGKLIVQLDQEAKENAPPNSRILALNPLDGKTLWEHRRPVTASWSTPIIVEVAGTLQVATVGNPLVMTYGMSDGNELWRAELTGGEVVPSPVFAGGLLAVANPATSVMGLKLGGTGDVTKQACVWTNEDNAPDITSPVSANGLLYTVTTGGTVNCLEARDGHKLWSQDLQFIVNASPAVVGNKLLVLAQTGEGFVLEAGREFKQVATNQLKDRFTASPAFAPGKIFLRGATNLYCLGKAESPSSKSAP